jgi:predicted Zn-dependent protease
MGRGSRPRTLSRSKSPNVIDRTPKTAIVDAAAKQDRSLASRAFAPVVAVYGTLGGFASVCIALWRNAGQRPRMSLMLHRGCKFPLVAALGLALSACSSALLSVGAPPGALPEPPRIAQQQPPVPNQREHQRILAAYNGAYDDPKLEALLNQTVAKLVAASERPDVHYRVTILNSAAVNAFALPTGQLYVTRGLIALASDTSELASVLSHEMSHVIARHAAIREDQARQVALVSRVVQDVLSDPETGALALAKSKIALASFSRAQEFEADGMGIGIAVRAGYDPNGATRFLTSMGRNADLKSNGSQSHIDPRAPDFLSSHPATPERIKNAQASARQITAPGGGERDKATYLATINGMVYGEDPSEGFVRGRRFLHPKLGFTFLAPEGFTLDNTAQAVLGVKEGGGQALRLDVVRVPAEQTLADYLNSGWIENIDPKSVEEVIVNGLPAATATAKGDQWTFRLYVVRFGSDVYRFIYASKHTTAEIDRAFRESVNTFRRMTLAESQAAKPLHIKIWIVEPGETVERLASRMALSYRQVERFRILNGLVPTDRVAPGDQVKIVVE